MSEPRPRLECRALTGGRGATVVFRNLDLDVQAGTVLALLGPNGAGKSTLLLTLAGLLSAHAGRASVDGTTLRNGNAVAASRAGVVLVPDDRSLFTTLTAEDSVSRYWLNLEEPHVSRLVQEVADFASGSIIGMLLAMFFRYWAFKRWVFPDELGHRKRTLTAVDDPAEELGHS